jgi:deoxyribonuclease-4
MKIGVHTSMRNGFVAALEEALALGCGTFQMFTQSPRNWKTRVYDEEEFVAFRRAREKSGLGLVVVHSTYLPNLCTSLEDLYRRSYVALVEDLERTQKLGAEFLVIHPGAYSPNASLEIGIERIADALNRAFVEMPGPSTVLIETMAGGGRRVGGPFAHIAEILKRVKNSGRVGVCFDTCHVLAQGYDISQPAGVDAALAEFEREIGLDRLRVFHCNDSKSPCGSHRDRHENLGHGYVGVDGLTHLFRARDWSGRAFILETPKLPMPASDLENLRVLKNCLGANSNVY